MCARNAIELRSLPFTLTPNPAGDFGPVRPPPRPSGHTHLCNIGFFPGGGACQDELCVPPGCCAEYPNPCSGECYEACEDGYQWDQENCPLCVDVTDREPPVAAILAPASGSTVPPGFTFQVTAFFSDSGEHASGVVSGTFTASGAALSSGPSPENFTIQPTNEITKQFSVGIKSDLTGIEDRTVTITAEGTDAEGNHSAVASISILAGGEGQALLLAISPQDPGPGVSVTVTVTVTNCLPESTQISYTVAGTDEYAQADTLSVDAQCQAGFTIPGGAEGVSDVVSAAIVGSGLSQTVTYVF